MTLSFHIFANAALGKGLSGSDRIFIEFAKRLSKKYKVTIHVWKEGYLICKMQGLREGISFEILTVDFWCKFGFLVCYLARILKAVRYALFKKIDNEKETIVYSASEFWMDSIPAFILKLRYPKTTWVAAWFQTAPNPLIGFSSGNRDTKYRLTALYYWLMQLPIKSLIERFADFVLINNEEEKKQFPNLNKMGKAIVILGGVNVEEIEKWRLKNRNLVKAYDAVFQGRFHPQKGVLELIDIWKLVTKDLPNAKLVMIGDGPLMGKVKGRIEELNLEKNVHLLGYVFDGPTKYGIFSQSKIVLHPAYYDSGGMASAEAMAFGLPCVGFDLNSYQSYYPRGMIKVKVGDLEKFADTIIILIKDKDKRNRIGEEAKNMIMKSWSWDKRFSQLMMALTKT